MLNTKTAYTKKMNRQTFKKECMKHKTSLKA